MKATVVDLRYKMNDILKALDRNEEVTVLYHGKVKGIIIPAGQEKYKDMANHPFFGMLCGKTEKSVRATIDKLRKVRYDDI
jgi:hypothetical protein